MIDRPGAIEIASRFAGTEPSAEASTIFCEDGWVVRIHPEADDIWVEEETGRAWWARMTADEWEHAPEPRKMLLAAAGRVEPPIFWRFVSRLGRLLWDHFQHEQERLAITTTERWLNGTETEDKLEIAWFNATGGGARSQHGWATADELLRMYQRALSQREACDLVRRLLGNPFRVDPGASPG
jgi:hypothetical protein